MGRKRIHEQGHENHERWLLTYADMITLLMAFFIMLYSMSVLNMQRFSEVAISIRSGFNGIVKGQGTSVLGSSGQFSIKPSPVESLGGLTPVAVKRIQSMLSESSTRNNIRLRQDQRGLVISLVTDKVIFAKGQADITPSAAAILNKVAGVLKEVPNQIQVEGHTCNLPISTERYPTNWELSSARASTVVRYLIETERIPETRFSAAGYADCRPLPGTPNTTEANRAMNRRVDIVIMKNEIL